MKSIYCILFFMTIVLASSLVSYCVPIPSSGRSPFSSIYSENKDNSNTTQGGGDFTDPDDPPSANTNDADDDLSELNENAIDEESMPYRIKIDTLAFMTCDNARFENPFTLFAGALLSNAGIRLKRPFADKEEVKQYPSHESYPALSIAPNRRGIPSEGSTILGFGIRRTIDLQDHINQLLRSGETYLQTIDRTKVQARLHRTGNLRDSINLARQLDRNNDGDYLTATFAFPKTNGKADVRRYTDDGDEYTHGLVYELNMQKIGEFHIIAGVDETDYQKKNGEPLRTEKQWNCPSSYRFTIYRHSNLISAGEPSCPEGGSRENFEYTILKEILGNDWNINTGRRCISPKRSNICYGELASSNVAGSRVVYDPDRCSITNRGNFCPHYLSFCIRN